jgi:hypothetical protein
MAAPSVIAHEAVLEISRQYTGVDHGQDGVTLHCCHIIVHKREVVGAVV